MVVVRTPQFRRPLLTSSAMSFCVALLVNASRMPMKKGWEPLPWDVEKDGARWKRLRRSHDPQKTLLQAVQVDLLQGIFCINLWILIFYILKCLVINSSNQ